MKSLKAQLKSIKGLETRINPDREWVLRNREQLMRQIEHTSSQATVHVSEAPKVAHSINTWTKIFVPRTFIRSLKPLSSVAFALVLTTLGWIASAYAEPGDVLWNAKNALNSVVESSRLALAPESQQASLKLSYASKQAHVLKQVVETDKLVGEEKARLVEITADSLQKKLTSAQESVKTIDPSDAENLVKEVSLSTQDISQTLKEAQETAGEGGIGDTIEKTAVETTKQSLQMVSDAVQKKTDANLEISSEEKEIVKDHIDQAVESIVAEATKVQNKLNSQSPTSTPSVLVLINVATTTVPLITTASTTLITTSTINTVTTVEEQKKTLNSLKETDLIQAINTTKALAEQVNTAIEKINNQLIPITSATTTTVTSTSAGLSSPTTSTPTSTSTIKSKTTTST